MKLATIKVDGAERVVGLIEGDLLVDIAGMSERKGLGPKGFPNNMIQLISAGWLGEELLKRVEELASKEGSDGPNADLFCKVSEAKWAAPVPKPGKMPFVFANGRFPGTEERLDPDSGGRFPRPLYFLKASSSIIAHKETVLINEDMGIVQPEAELAVVIGKKARNIKPDEVMDVIYGYSVLNDITGAGLSWQDGRLAHIPSDDMGKSEDYYTRPMARFKGVDTWGPFGPYLVPKNMVENIRDAKIIGRLDGRVVLEGPVSHYRFTLEECVSTISECMTLEPGDVISLGTVAPVGGRSLRRVNLTDADGGITEIEVTGIGVLSNPIKVLPPLWPNEQPAKTLENWKNRK
ncbi:MAG: fumarylacetoacetate hydrolase family protein [Anaerolineales bacterium]|nr:fumarylacetoacetate hydrolase family protein [Anaerolineales bacterium]